MKTKQKITTFLWYDGRAEEAARLYVSIFKKDAKVQASLKAWLDGQGLGLR